MHLLCDQIVEDPTEHRPRFLWVTLEVWRRTINNGESEPRNVAVHPFEVAVVSFLRNSVYSSSDQAM